MQVSSPASAPRRRLRSVRVTAMPFTRQILLLQVAVLLGLGVASMVAVSLLLNSTLDSQYEQRALAVARTVAADRDLADLVRQGDQRAVQAIASAQQSASGALFVVVTDDRGVRLAHPNPEEIGRPVSTDPSAALAGREVSSIETGTLGLSARGKVPLRDASGAVVGEVSVGFAASDIGGTLRGVLLLAVPVGLLAVALGAVLSGLLTRRMKRATFGLEPAAMADLVREHQAVLHGIGEGVLALDRQHRITMANDEARRLLGTPAVAGTDLGELDLPGRLAAAITAADGHAENLVTVSGDRVLIANLRRVHLGGRDLGTVLTVRDRTDLEELTSELAGVRSLTSALRAQRHEFANRMHTVMGLLQTGSHQDAVEYLQASTQFTAAADIDADTVRSTTIRAFLAAKTARAAELGIRLQLSQESWVPQKLVAPVEVITVLGNLVDNAVEAAGASPVRPGRVEVDLVADGRDLVLSVVNTGDGIPVDQLATIFAEGVSSKGTHRGMGLAISRQTARGLGGDLWVSQAGGGGTETVFVSRLPEVLAPTEAEPVDA